MEVRNAAYFMPHAGLTTHIVYFLLQSLLYSHPIIWFPSF